MKNAFSLTLAFIVVTCLGCKDPNGENKVAENQGTATGIFGQTTDEIGDFQEGQPNQTVSDGKMKDPSIYNPMGYALNGYGSAIEMISKDKITQAVEMFRATTGRYPKSHEEFMTKVVKEYQIQLPVLPGERKYQYDVENHELKIVIPQKQAAPGDAQK